MRFSFAFFLAMLLAACGQSASDGPINVAIIGEPRSLLQQGVRLSYAAQHLRGATHEGLVGLDASGQVVPAVAERWIVTDDGLSYIFKLRDSEWPDGAQIESRDVQRLLRENVRRLRGTSLGLDLAKIEEIRAMAGRVVEIRLTSPMPEFLRVMAQPELGFTKDGSGVGPMVMSTEEGSDIVRLSALPPETRGLPARENWEDIARPIALRALPAPAAVEAFGNGEVDLVTGGRLSHLPLADTGPLSRGTVRLDGALGLFGLSVRNDKGILAEPELREAISMAIDREGLVQAFNIGGWESLTWIIPSRLGGDVTPPEQRWSGMTLAQRRAVASRRIDAWNAATEEEPKLKIGLPSGPGSEIFFRRLAQDLAAIGVVATMVPIGEPADLELRDRLARYAAPRWFLDQFHCSLRAGLCSPEADDLVAQALVAQDPQAEKQLLAAAQRELVAAEVFIPIGDPIRWSLVRGNIAGYQANQWGLHPLFPLSEPTI